MVLFLLYSKSKFIKWIPNSPFSQNFAILLESKRKQDKGLLTGSIPGPISALLKEGATSFSRPRDPSSVFVSLVNMQGNNVNSRQNGQQPIKLFLAK